MNIRNILFFVFFLFIFVVVPAFVIWPSVQTIRQTAQSIYSEYEQLEAKHKRGHEMKFVAQEFRELEPKVEVFQNVALKPGDELKFITNLETIATNNRVQQTLRLKTDSIESSGRRYQKLPFELTISGQYADVLKHISEIESLDNLTQIEELRMSPGAERAQNQSLQVRLSAFVLQEKE